MFPGNPEKFRVFLKPGHTDMRKSINGLSVISEENLKQNSLGGDLFVFCNRRRTILKILYWNKNGFCLWLKRLEKNKFPWPDSEDECLEITEEQLNWLLSGIDFFHMHKSLNYSRVT